ncbi:hypothetical protein MKW92_035981 [Papaver armeniacum]|nr:hypothetical protein MKW92_035981 [Papaver armeniacum]
MVSLGIRNFTDRIGDGAGEPLLDVENGEELMHIQPLVAIVLANRPPESPGTLYITTKRIIWLSDVERELGYVVDFLSISLHAVSTDPEAYALPCIYAQVETLTTGQEQSDSDSIQSLDLSEIEEMRLIPSDPTQLDDLFDIFCQCAELNPDPDAEPEDDPDWVFNADQIEVEEDDGGDCEDPENPIGFSNGEHELSRSVLELQIDDQRFQDASEEMGRETDSGYIIGENSIILAMASAVIVISCWYSFGNGMSKRNGEQQYPPGPRGLPLIGSLLSCGSDLHTYFGKLAEAYGPVIKVRMDSKIYVTNDSILANRDTPIAALVSSYGGSDIAWSPSNSEWRKLRKVLAHELLSKKSLESCYDLRREEIRKTVEIYKLKISTPINCGEEVFVTILNVITGMLWGGTVIVELNTLVGKPNVSDFFPVLRCFDIQGIERKATALSVWLDCKIDLVIDHKEKLKDKDQFQSCQSNENRKDFVQLLLELMEQKDAERQITRTQLKALFVDIAMAGTDATSTTIEWVMTEMMQHPEVMKRVQAELDQVVGINNMVEESHLTELHYLNAVVKETFRLHSAAPLLLPHSSSSSCQIGGYIIPKGVTVLCNAWSIHRDPEVWVDPLKFHPERFLSNGDVKKFDYNGNNFSYIPFGSGRRISKRMLPYVLASLLHSFDWRLPKDAKLDLRETFGVALKKTTPLVVIPTPRLDNLELYM